MEQKATHKKTAWQVLARGTRLVVVCFIISVVLLYLAFSAEYTAVRAVYEAY